MSEIPSDEEGWAAVERLGRLLHPSKIKTHAPDSKGNARCDPGNASARRRVVQSGPITCETCLERLAAEVDAVAGWEALEQYAQDNGWDDE